MIAVTCLIFHQSLGIFGMNIAAHRALQALNTLSLLLSVITPVLTTDVYHTSYRFILLSSRRPFCNSKMGKLNIAHHKSYHPYRRDNIERVRRDEEEARLKEAAQEGKMALAVSKRGFMDVESTSH